MRVTWRHKWISDFPVRSSDQIGIQELAYPSNAIPGELVFHFDSRSRLPRLSQGAYKCGYRAARPDR